MVFKVLSAVFLLIIVVYTIIKWYLNSIGGIYCFKRLLLGVILGAISSLGGIDDNLPLTIVLLLGS